MTQTATPRLHTYMAVANRGGYAVRQISPGCTDLHPISNCRDFATFDEADDVARRMANGEFLDIRPPGIYVCNR